MSSKQEALVFDNMAYVDHTSNVDIPQCLENGDGQNYNSNDFKEPVCLSEVSSVDLNTPEQGMEENKNYGQIVSDTSDDFVTGCELGNRKGSGQYESEIPDGSEDFSESLNDTMADLDAIDSLGSSIESAPVVDESNIGLSHADVDLDDIEPVVDSDSDPINRNEIEYDPEPRSDSKFQSEPATFTVTSEGYQSNPSEIYTRRKSVPESVADDTGLKVRNRRVSFDHSSGKLNGIDNKAFELAENGRLGIESQKKVPFPDDEEKKISLLENNLTNGKDIQDGRPFPLPPSATKRKDSEAELDPDMFCGIGSCKPSSMQRCKNMLCFAGVYSLAGIVTSALSAYITSQITTLEKHFNLNSSVSGFLMSCNDLGYLVTTLFFSYYTRKLHIPRSLALSTIVYGVSGLICTIPFFGTRDKIPKPPPPVGDGGMEGFFAMMKFPAKMCTGAAPNLAALAAMANMPGMPKIPNVANLARMANLANMQNMTNMPNMANMPNLENKPILASILAASKNTSLGNLPNMPNAANLPIVPDMPSVMPGFLSSLMNNSGGGIKPSMIPDMMKNLTCEQMSGGSGAVVDLSEGWRQTAVVLLAVGMIVQGIAKSPRQPFLSTYVDDNVPKTKTTMYLGTIVGLAIFGPALAFVLGGVFTTKYITLEATSMTPMDPRFIGAWWLGFLMFGSIALVVGIPIMFFPRRMRKQKRLQEMLKKQKLEAEGKPKLMHETKSILRTLLRLASNPIYMATLLANGLHLMGISGLIAFMPKYLETQFTIPAWKANIIIGALNVASAAAGTILGGCLTSKFKLSPKACLVSMIIASVCSSALLSAGFGLGCDQPEIVGFGSSENTSSLSPCANNCNCLGASYFPVCGADGRNYFSPCHAGCKGFGSGISFSNCSCLATTPALDGDLNLNASRADESLFSATAGLCSSDCGNLYPYSILAFFSAFFATICIMPSFIVSVRSVSEIDKPFAMGLSAFAGTLIGWFPGPVIFGSLVDTTCVIWSGGQCKGQGLGSCKLYDIELLRLRFHGLLIGLRGINILILVVALLLAVFTNCVKFQPHTDASVVVLEEKEVGGGDSMSSETKA